MHEIDDQQAQGGWLSGAWVPTVATAGKVHLLMDVDGRLACRTFAPWPVRRIRWLAPSELTCPDCWHALTEAHQAE